MLGPSELEVLGSILGDSNVCFDFLLICVAALALYTRKTEYWQRKEGGGGKVRKEGHKFISYLITVAYYIKKVALASTATLLSTF